MVTSDADPMLPACSAAEHIGRATADGKLNRRATITVEVCATTDKELNRRVDNTGLIGSLPLIRISAEPLLMKSSTAEPLKLVSSVVELQYSW